MALDGVWSMSDDGEFTLNEPYNTKLKEARYVAASAWTQSLLEYLVDECPYTIDELQIALLQRCGEEGMAPSEIVNEFVLEALIGDL